MYRKMSVFMYKSVKKLLFCFLVYGNKELGISMIRITYVFLFKYLKLNKYKFQDKIFPNVIVENLEMVTLDKYFNRLYVILVTTNMLSNTRFIPFLLFIFIFLFVAKQLCTFKKYKLFF